MASSYTTEQKVNFFLSYIKSQEGFGNANLGVVARDMCLTDSAMAQRHFRTLVMSTGKYDLTDEDGIVDRDDAKDDESVSKPTAVCKPKIVSVKKVDSTEISEVKTSAKKRMREKGDTGESDKPDNSGTLEEAIADDELPAPVARTAPVAADTPIKRGRKPKAEAVKDTDKADNTSKVEEEHDKDKPNAKRAKIALELKAKARSQAPKEIKSKAAPKEAKEPKQTKTKANPRSKAEPKTPKKKVESKESKTSRITAPRSPLPKKVAFEAEARLHREIARAQKAEADTDDEGNEEVKVEGDEDDEDDEDDGVAVLKKVDSGTEDTAVAKAMENEVVEIADKAREEITDEVTEKIATRVADNIVGEASGCERKKKAELIEVKGEGTKDGREDINDDLVVEMAPAEVDDGA